MSLCLVQRTNWQLQIELEFETVGFWGDGKTTVSGQKHLGARTRTNSELNQHKTMSLGIESGLHWWPKLNIVNYFETILKVIRFRQQSH